MPPRDGDALNAALQAYEADRRPRTAAITTEAWRIGQVLHWTNPVACALRNLAFQGRPKRAWVKQQEKRLGAFQE
jgi:2-polyprenyl-6-methoxyphenol hydroxylase-like FAD-dependent oxidoreductase